MTGDRWPDNVVEILASIDRGIECVVYLLAMLTIIEGIRLFFK